MTSVVRTMLRLRRTYPLLTALGLLLAMFRPLQAQDGDHPLELATPILETVREIWHDFLAHIPFLAGGIAVLIGIWVITMLVDKFGHAGLRRFDMRPSARELMLRLATIAIWIVGLFLAAMVIFPDVDPADALGGLGLVSVAVGLAFRDIFENFFAGILILWKYPFQEGDYIECKEIIGRVERIAVRMSELRKVSGELVVVPNSFLYKNPVDVLTDRTRRRVTVMTGVAYDQDLDGAVEVIARAVRGCSTVFDEYDVEIFPHAFGESSMEIEVTWWAAPTPLEQRESIAEVISAVKRALDEADIEIPYPYRTLTFKDPIRLSGQER